MKITVNGREMDVTDGITVYALLESLGVVPATMVVQQNDAIVERKHYESTIVAEGDVLELIRMVGGG